MRLETIAIQNCSLDDAGGSNIGSDPSKAPSKRFPVLNSCAGKRVKNRSILGVSQATMSF